jgi:hypothetical protein
VTARGIHWLPQVSWTRWSIGHGDGTRPVPLLEAGV